MRTNDARARLLDYDDLRYHIAMASETEKASCKRKVRYANDAAAQAALKRINPSHALKKPTRVYKCPVCSGYHLTSQRQK